MSSCCPTIAISCKECRVSAQAPAPHMGMSMGNFILCATMAQCEYAKCRARHMITVKLRQRIVTQNKPSKAKLQGVIRGTTIWEYILGAIPKEVLMSAYACCTPRAAILCNDQVSFVEAAPASSG